jgi:hypothetical protein
MNQPQQPQVPALDSTRSIHRHVLAGLVIVLVLATHCACPADSAEPFSPTWVSYPSGSPTINSCTPAA